jgi:hypothetical protein
MEMDLFYRAAGKILAPFRYAQREIEEKKENLKEEAQWALSTVLKMSAMALFALFFLTFVSISGAMAINDSMDSPYLGFALIAAFYLLAAICVFIWYKVSSRKREHAIKHSETHTVPA